MQLKSLSISKTETDKFLFTQEVEKQAGKLNWDEVQINHNLAKWLHVLWEPYAPIRLLLLNSQVNRTKSGNEEDHLRTNLQATSFQENLHNDTIQWEIKL